MKELTGGIDDYDIMNVEEIEEPIIKLHFIEKVRKKESFIKVNLGKALITQEFEQN